MSELFDPKKCAESICLHGTRIIQIQHLVRPLVEKLALVLQECYLASLHTEEDRAVKFNLLVCAGESVGSNFDEYRDFSHDSRKPLTSHELRKLAPATGLDSIWLVTRIDLPEPQIIGFIDLGAKWTSFQRAEDPESGAYLPHILITVSGPGTLSVSFGDELLAKVERGLISEAELNVLRKGPVKAFLNDIIASMITTVGNWNNFLDGYSENCFDESVNFEGGLEVFRSEYLRCLANLVWRTANLGHGGAIVLVHQSELPTIGNYVDIKYRASENSPSLNSIQRHLRLFSEPLYYQGRHSVKHPADEQLNHRHRLWNKGGLAA